MRIPVVKNDDTVPIPPAVDTSDINNDDNDGDNVGKYWCYYNQPSFGNVIMCVWQQPIIIYINLIHFD